jgi:hypothetical protein
MRVQKGFDLRLIAMLRRCTAALTAWYVRVGCDCLTPWQMASRVLAYILIGLIPWVI